MNPSSGGRTESIADVPSFLEGEYDVCVDQSGADYLLVTVGNLLKTAAVQHQMETLVATCNVKATPAKLAVAPID